MNNECIASCSIYNQRVSEILFKSVHVEMRTRLTQGDVIFQSNLIHLLKLDISLSNEAIFRLTFHKVVFIIRVEYLTSSLD